MVNKLSSNYLNKSQFFKQILFLGFIWPTQGARHFVKYTNKFVPITLAIEALRGITMRGWSIDHTAVYMGFVSMLIWALIFYVISYALYKSKKGTWKKV